MFLNRAIFLTSLFAMACYCFSLGNVQKLLGGGGGLNLIFNFIKTKQKTRPALLIFSSDSPFDLGGRREMFY